MTIIVGTPGCLIKDVISVLAGKETFSVFNDKYLDIAMALGIYDEIQHKFRRDIVLNNATLKETVKNLLTRWVCVRGKKATLADLIRILKDENMTQCAESLEDSFCIINSGNNGGEEDSQEQDVPDTAYCRPLQRCYRSRGDSCSERDLLLNLIINGVTFESLSEKDSKGCTLLHNLLKPGADLPLDLFNKLVQYLFNIESATLFDVQGWRYNSTPLHWLMCSLKPDVSLLYNLKWHGGVNLNAEDIFRDSTLAYAIAGKQSAELIFSLMAYGANWENVNLNRDTLLHHAARSGHVEACELIKFLGGNINAINADGETPGLIFVTL